MLHDNSVRIAIEVELAPLFELVDLLGIRPERRLNAFENLVSDVAIARIPRVHHVTPLPGVQLSEETLHQLVAWAVIGDAPDEKMRARIAHYASARARESRVPRGWIRIWVRRV